MASHFLLARLNLFAQVAGLSQRQGDLTQTRGEIGGQIKLSRQRVLRRLHPGIQLDGERLSPALAVRRELDSVFTGHRQRSSWSPERAPHALWWGIMQVPHESVHPSLS